MPDIKMNVADLYLEESFTDRQIGTLKRLTPVTPDGTTDNSRRVIYVGMTQVMTPVGALPLSFEISADSLSQALEQFPQAAKLAIEQAVRELQELRREAASSIVVPDAGMGGRGGMGGIPGAGGGKIQLR
jgi:hypothetical protein